MKLIPSTRLGVAVVSAAGLAAAAGLTGGGYALASTDSPAATIPAANNQLYACVTYNPATKVARTISDAYTSKANFLSWLNAKPQNGHCPDSGFAVGLAGGAQGPAGPQGPSGVVSTGTTTLVSSPKTVATGGSFSSGAQDDGTIDLKSAGTYTISVNAKATPSTSSATEVFPQFYVYNGPAAADFSNDLFNVGSGSLATDNTVIDSYYSGTDQVTVTGPTTLYVYAFGYDSDRSAGNYNLDSLTATVTQLQTSGS